MLQFVELRRAAFEGFGCRAVDDDLLARGGGNEPFWSVEVHRDQATFSTPESGWMIAEQAEIGFTEDRYGWQDPWNCNQTFTGIGAPYAGLWANLQCQAGESRSMSESFGVPQTRVTRVEADAPSVLEVYSGE